MVYDPKSVAAAGIVLPAELDALIEGLAEQIHDTWARRRLDEGWRYGERRDDAAKTHPGLVPYGELSTSEQAYDRETALATLRSIVALGYRLVPPGAPETR